MHLLPESPRGRIVPAVILLAGLAACGTDTRQATDPSLAPVSKSPTAAAMSAARAGSGFFPLEIGNRWTYDHPFRIDYLPNDGSTIEPFIEPGSETREIIATEDLFGRTYFVEQQDRVQIGPGGEENEFRFWERYRQDRSGLYEGDICLSDPPGPGSGEHCGEASSEALAPARPSSSAAIPGEVWNEIQRKRSALLSYLGTGDSGRPAFAAGQGGGLPNEITRLEYPLHPGTEWHVREDPLIVCRVEAMDVVDVPAGRFNAWRVSLVWPGVFGPKDVVYLWFSREGFIRMYFFVESEWTNVFRGDLGIIRYTETMDLTDISAAGHTGSSGAERRMTNVP